MFIICCTSKLLNRTGFHAESDLSDPILALGNWYANILFFPHRQFLLFVSELSRLAVVTPAKQTRLMSNHLTQHLSILLNHLNIKSEWIDAEIQQMVDVRYAATKSRSVLGTMNDFKSQIEAQLEMSLKLSELEIALNLNDCPVGPLKYRTPEQATFELLRMCYGTD